MFPSPWQNWLRRLSLSISGSDRRRLSRSAARRLRRLHLERLEDRVVPTVTALTNFNGVNFGESAAVQANTIGGGATPPDPQGAVGPNSYIEAVNLTFAIYNPKTSNVNPVTDAIDDFFNYQGNLPDPNPNDPSFSQSFSDCGVLFDEQTQRFIISCMEVDPGPQFGSQFGGDNSSVFDFAVSKSSNPLTLTSADWNFYQVNTTEINKANGTNFFSDFPGNLGYNDGALVVTLNEFNPDTQVIDHVLVNAINMSDVTNGVPQANAHIYQSDFKGMSLRPTTMHDSTSVNDPMWFVEEHPGSGGLGDGQHIDVVKMTNVLSSTPTYTTTTLAVKPYTDVSLTPPLQPDGSVVTPDLDSRILKTAERNNLLVAANSVSVSSTQDDAQWYAIDLSSGTPSLKQQGDVSAGNNTYITYPGIDINAAGAIGMSYMQSGTDSSTDFLSMYVTGRTSTDPSGTMETPVLAQAGQQVYQDFGPSAGSDQRAGDLSGINVDAQGNFWAINEFADNEPLPSPTAPSADWGTNITDFTFAAVADLTVTATGPATVTAGGSASYTVTLTNNGPNAAQNVVLKDILPAGATNASITPVSNPDNFSFTLSNGVFTSNSVTVANGHQDKFTVTVSVPSGLAAGAVFDDTATVTSTTIDPNPYDDAATVTGSTGQTITISANYNAISYGQSAALLGGVGSTPPDNQGAVGPNSYIEAVNDAIGIYSPRTGTTSPITDSLDDFFATQGKLPDPNPNDQFGNFITDPFVVFDEQTQRFIVGVMEVDPGPQFTAQSTGNNSSVLDLAVSTTSNPASLKTTDWNFYQINTTEANPQGGNYFSDYPGNAGYNGGALVVTLNEFNGNNPQNPDHVLVNAINLSDLTSGVSQGSLRFYQSDFKGMSLRPTTMHDSTSANDPMWFVEEHLDATGNPDNQHIDVVKMTNVLSSTPTYTTTTLAVTPYSQIVPPLQPDGSYVTPYLDSRIMKVAEQGGTLVAAQAVANGAGNQDLVQWYKIGVGSGTPALQDQGDVGAGPNTYLYFPGIDINPAGNIGMSYMQSGTDNANDFLSMYITGRTPSDPSGTMEAPVLAQAGQQVYEDYGPAFSVTQRAGDLSAINVDSSGNFWALNEFADDEALPTSPGQPVGDPNSPGADWGTNVVSFSLPKTTTSALVFTQVTLPDATEGKATGTYTVATFTDSNPNPNINNLTATVTWGDGSSDTLTAANGGIVASGNGYAVKDGHTYAEEGSSLPFSVKIADSAGGSATDSAMIGVADAALSSTADNLTPPTATEGKAFNPVTVFHFTDADPAAAVTDYTAVVTLGDGNSVTLNSSGVVGTGPAGAGGKIVANSSGGFDVQLSYTYAEELANKTFSVSVSDAGSSTSQSLSTFSVADASLSVTGVTTTTGTAFNGKVASFTDADPNGTASDYTATINWGDGQSSAGTVSANSQGGFDVTGSHTYTTANTYTVSVSITDAGGSSVSANSTLTVTATPQFSDPGFEMPSVGTGTNAYKYNPTGVPWTYSTSSGVAGNGSAFTAGNPNAPQGTQVGFIQGTGTISQAVSFAAGTYTISFDAAQRANYQASSQTIAVEVDSTVVGTIKPSSTTYSLYTTNAFTLTAGTHTVSFVGLNPNGGDNTAFIDQASIATATSPPPASNQFNDPGFEMPSVGTGTNAYKYNPTGIPWTCSTSSGVAGNGSAFTAGNPNAPQGTQVAFIQSTGTISQIVSFTAGSYTISFDAAQRANFQGSYQTVAVEVDGTVIGTVKAASTSYALYTTTAFTVTAGTHTVSFVGLNPNGGDNTAFIDQASIATATSPPPASNQFNDPNFAVPNVGTGTNAYQYNPTGAPWTYSTHSGVAGNGSAFTSGNPNAPVGTQVAFIQGTGTISQTVTFTAGTFTISFDAAQRANYQSSSQTIEVEVDGTVVATIKPTGTSYALYTTGSFTVTAGTHTVSFVGLNPNGGDNTAFLDAASIAAA